MPHRLPLFPLGRVLFPGAVLPLHVFEERYRLLVRELLTRSPPDREIGIIAIRSGSEVGSEGAGSLYDIGCVSRLVHATELADGRFDLVTVGTSRFRLRALHTDQPYLVGDVELLAEDTQDATIAPADLALGAAVRAAFTAYQQALRDTGLDIDAAELPAAQDALGYLVAGAVLLDLADRQALLAADGRERLRRERALLRRETVLLHTLRAAPALGLAQTPVSVN